MGRWIIMLLSFVVGIVLAALGFINLFWGNDPFFGLGIFAASGLYFFPIASKIRSLVEPKWWRWALVILALLIVWAALGVGDLEGKLELMQDAFPMPNITDI